MMKKGKSTTVVVISTGKYENSASMYIMIISPFGGDDDFHFDDIFLFCSSKLNEVKRFQAKATRCKMRAACTPTP